MFFWIERTGLPGGGPARSTLSVRCPTPHIPGLIRDGHLVFFSVPAHIGRPCNFRQSSLLCDRLDFHSILLIYPHAPATGRTPPRATRSYVPRSWRHRLRRRRFAPVSRTDRHPCLLHRLSPSHSLGEGERREGVLLAGDCRDMPSRRQHQADSDGRWRPGVTAGRGSA